jgi:hypothetical protein
MMSISCGTAEPLHRCGTDFPSGGAGDSASGIRQPDAFRSVASGKEYFAVCAGNRFLLIVLKKLLRSLNPS